MDLIPIVDNSGKTFISRAHLYFIQQRGQLSQNPSTGNPGALLCSVRLFLT
jgi:hypothetical protein